MVGIFLNSRVKQTSNVAAIAMFAAILLAFMVPSSMATTSRVSSLGGGGDYFEDDSNVGRWFGSLADYPNQVILESGNFNISDGYWYETGWKRSGPGFTSHLNLGQDGRFGTAAFAFHDQDETSRSSVYRLHLHNNLSFLYSLDLGPLTAGISYRHSDASAEKFNSGFELPVNAFGAGLRMDLGESAYLDLAGDVLVLDEDQFGDSGPKEHGANNCYGFRGRAFIGLGPRMAVVPLVEVVHQELQQAASPDEFFSDELQRFGIGLNYFPDTDHLLLLNAEYTDGRKAYYTPLVTLSDNRAALSWKAGFESRVLSWLTTRGSICYYDHELEDPIMRLNLGASIHLGPVDLDFSFADLDPEANIQTPDLLQNKHWLSITARYLF